MIDKEWRDRFKTLSERLDCVSPSKECEFALKKFGEIRGSEAPEEKESILSQLLRENEQEQIETTEAAHQDYDAMADSLADKAIDAGIWASILLRK